MTTPQQDPTPHKNPAAEPEPRSPSELTAPDTYDYFRVTETEWRYRKVLGDGAMANDLFAYEGVKPILVGGDLNTSGFIVPALWVARGKGEVQRIELSLGGHSWSGAAIHFDYGHIIGFKHDPTRHVVHSLLWESLHAEPHVIAPLRGHNALDICASNEFLQVGSSYLWTDSGRKQELPIQHAELSTVPLPLPKGFTSGRALSVHQGLIVGGVDADGTGYRPVAWVKGKPVLLDCPADGREWMAVHVAESKLALGCGFSKTLGSVFCVWDLGDGGPDGIAAAAPRIIEHSRGLVWDFTQTHAVTLRDLTRFSVPIARGADSVSVIIEGRGIDELAEATPLRVDKLWSFEDPAVSPTNVSGLGADGSLLLTNAGKKGKGVKGVTHLFRPGKKK